MTTSNWFPEFIAKYLTFSGKCYRHCDKPTSMRVLFQDPNRLVGAYVCPDGFVSQVVHFGLKADVDWFRSFLHSQVGSENVSQRDLRVASRHGWELGGDALKTLEGKIGTGSAIKEVYWTRYPKTEEEKQLAVSLCIGNSSQGGCMRLILHDKNSKDEFCPACKSKYRIS